MTVREIADLAGVSIGTVDRVLHKRGRVSPETRAKIEAIIDKHRFSPNLIARQLKRGRPYRFCALVPGRCQDAGYWGQILEGVERAAAEIAPMGAETIIEEFDRYDFKALKKAAAAIRAEKPDGLVFAPIMPERTRAVVGQFQDAGIPLAFVDSEMPGAQPLCAISQDPFSGGYLAGRLFHLFAGTVAKPVAVLDAHGEDYHIARRRDGFLQYAREQNFPVLVQEYSDYKGIEISADEIARFLDGHPALSGIFITNCMAHRVAEAAARQRSRRGKLIIAGYDLIPKNRELLRRGKIDAIISQRPEEQGREALLTLFRSVALQQAVKPRHEIPLDVYIKENAPD